MLVHQAHKVLGEGKETVISTKRVTRNQLLILLTILGPKDDQSS